MFRSGILRKPGSLLTIGSVALAVGTIAFATYQRRCAQSTKHEPDGDIFEADAASTLPNSQRLPTSDDLVETSSREDTPPANGEDEDEGDDDDDDDDQCCDDDPLEDFENVLRVLDNEKLASVATALRISRLTLEKQQLPTPFEMLQASCNISGLLTGAYNLVYRITFMDGIQWFARVPGHGARFTDLDAKKMDSEYDTMRYIKSQTRIPMPDVVFWTTSLDIIGSPFGIVTAAEGLSLNDVWDSLSEEKRLACLTDIARHMAEMHQLSFDRIGALNFSNDGTTIEAGPLLRFENPVILTGDLEMNNKLYINIPTWPPTVASGPYSSSLSSLYARIEDAIPPGMSPADRANGTILRHFVETMPSELLDERMFYLHMPDLDKQNIFVDTDGTVTSFIDWDLVSTESSMAGFAAFPRFLSVDWVPLFYDYDPDEEEHDENGPPPEVLRKYRQHYSKAMAGFLAEYTDYDARMTKLSHVAYAFGIAVGNQLARPNIVWNLWQKAKIPFEMLEYDEDFKKGDTAEKDAVIQECFAKAWESGWDSADDYVDPDMGAEEGGKDSKDGSVVTIEEPVDANDCVDN